MEDDKVVINGRRNSTNNLHQLPDVLDVFDITSKSSPDCIGFFGALNLLSNFYESKFTVGRIEYISSEQYIQAQKAALFDDESSYNHIMGATNSLDCKNVARSVRNFDRVKWESAAGSLCKEGLRVKFAQNPYLLETLTQKTGNKTLLECANDMLWANGVPLYSDTCLNRDKWISQGLLGCLLEEIRTELSPCVIQTSARDTLPKVVSETPSVEATNTNVSVNLNHLKSLFMTPCTESEALNLISKLPTKMSSGHDNISNVLLKAIGHFILCPLTNIFNDSLSTGIFPNVMKVADMVPLYKGKERFLETNYRPISLLLIVSKILEKIVYSWVYKFLNDNHQLYESQYGFPNQHSCDNAVGEVVSQIGKNLEQNRMSVAFFLDLSKALDTLQHDLLLHKMERYGLRGTVLNWFKSYLTNRRIRVK